MPPRLGGASAQLASPRRAFLSKEMQEADLRAHVLFKAQQTQDILSSPSSSGERQRYFANASANRPYELELDRWNHEAKPAGGGEDMDDNEEEESGRAAFEQLSCLTGRFRQNIRGPGGGVGWTPVKGLCGVFLRRRNDPIGAMLWLPEAGPNLLLQARAGGPWELLQVARLQRQRVIAGRAPKTRYNQDMDLNIYVEAAAVDHQLGAALSREADPHLTERWLESAADLRSLWEKDWRPLRQTSGFELAQSKFRYHPDNKPTDTFRGCFGEERWQWCWEEDGRGALSVRNRLWPSDARLWLAADEVSYQGAAGQRLAWAAEGSGR